VATSEVSQAASKGSWRRRRQSRGIASLEAMHRRIDVRAQATGETRDEAAAVVVEELETAANSLTARTAPLVPGCGVLVAISGLAVKAEPRSQGWSEVFVSLAVLWAVAGFSFLTYALFAYAGRRELGLAPTVEDVAFARARLVRKRANAYRGGCLAGIGLACLIIGILLGVRIDIQA
jgi:hypothetical protein